MRLRAIGPVFLALLAGVSLAAADDGRGIDVAFDEGKTLVWGDGADHLSWNVYAGDLDTLRATGVYTQAAAPLVTRSCDLDAPRFSYDDLPEPGRCAFLLVSGNAVVEGGLGTDSSGGIRPNTESCHPDFTAPEPAGTPTAVAGHCRGLVVTWPASPSPDVTTYRVSAGTSPATPLYVWPVSGTVTYIDGLSDSTTYYLSVVAVDAAGNESAPTEEIAIATANTTTPQAPKELNAADGGPGVVNALAWPPVTINDAPLPGDPASPVIRDLAGYRIYRSAGGDLPLDDAHRIADLDAASSSDGDLVRACSHHFYAVTAMDTCGLESAPSPKVEVVAAVGPAPRAPAGLHVMPIGATNVVSWSPSTSDVEGRPIAAPTYVVERAGPAKTAPGDAGFQKIAVQDGTLQAIDTIFPATQPDEKLYYRVKALDDCPTASAPSPIVEAACPFPGTVTVLGLYDNGTFAGAMPLTVWVDENAGPMAGVRIDYTHTVAGLTRTFVSQQPGPYWNDLWLTSPEGDYVITVTVTAVNGCIAEKRLRVHAGSNAPCCLSLYPTTTRIATCAGGATKCREVSYRIGNDRCLTAASLAAMNIGWVDYTNNQPSWQTARINGTNVAAPGTWATSYTSGSDPTGSASRGFGAGAPQVPYATPMTAANTTVVTYVFNSFLDAGSGSARKVDVFTTNQLVFRLLDAVSNPSEVTTTCVLPQLAVN